MTQVSPEMEQPEIEMPNLDNLDPWLEKYIVKGSPSYEPLGPEEALSRTRQQYQMYAEGLKQAGISEGTIQEGLVKFARLQNPTSERK